METRSSHVVKKQLRSRSRSPNRLFRRDDRARKTRNERQKYERRHSSSSSDSDDYERRFFSKRRKEEKSSSRSRSSKSSTIARRPPSPSSNSSESSAPQEFLASSSSSSKSQSSDIVTLPVGSASRSTVKASSSITIPERAAIHINSCLDCLDGLALIRFKPCNHQISCQYHGQAMKFCRACGTNIQKKLIMDIDGNEVGQLYLETKLYQNVEYVEDIEDPGICNICMDRKRDITFVPCGHGACSSCSQKLKLCHMDRSKIIQKIKMKFP